MSRTTNAICVIGSGPLGRPPSKVTRSIVCSMSHPLPQVTRSSRTVLAAPRHFPPRVESTVVASGSCRPGLDSNCGRVASVKGIGSCRPWICVLFEQEQMDD